MASALEDRITAPEETKPAELAEENTQTDGATEFLGENAINEPAFDVDVKPYDPDSPLVAIKTFQELEL